MAATSETAGRAPAPKPRCWWLHWWVWGPTAVLGMLALLVYVHGAFWSLGGASDAGYSGCGTGYTSLEGIASGADGNLWVTDYGASRIDRITPTGQMSTFILPGQGRGPDHITRGPDGNIWFTEQCVGIGRIAPNGAFADFSLDRVQSIGDIIAGPDGNMWFTENEAADTATGFRYTIGRITPSGGITTFPVGDYEERGGRLSRGRDGNLWFTEHNGDGLGRITPQGTIKEYRGLHQLHLEGITLGSDGNLWFTDGNGRIGRLTASGSITYFPLPSQHYPERIVAGPDGNLWIAEAPSSIGRLTPAGKMTEVSALEADDIAFGPDGNLWFIERGGSSIGPPAAIGRITMRGVVTIYPV